MKARWLKAQETEYTKVHRLSVDGHLLEFNIPKTNLDRISVHIAPLKKPQKLSPELELAHYELSFTPRDYNDVIAHFAPLKQSKTRITMHATTSTKKIRDIAKAALTILAVHMPNYANRRELLSLTQALSVYYPQIKIYSPESH